MRVHWLFSPNAILVKEKLFHFRSLPLEGKVSADRLTDEVDGTAWLTTSSTASARNMPPACFNLSLKGKAFSFVSISPIYEFSPVSLREGAVFLSIYSGHPTKKEDFDLLL